MPNMSTAQAAAAASSRRAPARLSAAYVVLAVFCAAIAAAVPRARAQSLTCFTSIDASCQDDADQCVNFVRTKGDTPCCQTEHSGCTTMAFLGTAAVDICGGLQHSCTTCIDAGDNLNQILANCVATLDGVNRVAGKITSGDLTFRIRSNTRF